MAIRAPDGANKRLNIFPLQHYPNGLKIPRKKRASHISVIELWRSEDGRLFADEGGLEIVRWNFSLPIIRKEMVRFQIFSGSGSTETVRFLTLLGPAYLSVSKDQRGGDGLRSQVLVNG